jgi:uncharacterized membrane protein YtjA (UPF0391 family)
MNAALQAACQPPFVAESLRRRLATPRTFYNGDTRFTTLPLRHGVCSLASSFTPYCEGRSQVMLSWALAFFIIAIIAAVFGFTGIAAGAAEIAKILFVVFVVLFLVSLVAGLLRRP